MLRTPTERRTRSPGITRLERHAMLRVACFVVLVTAALASEPGLTELNGQGFWKQFEHGFRGLEHAALSQATRLEHILREAMHIGGRPKPDVPATAKDDKVPQGGDDDDEAPFSAGLIPTFVVPETSSEEDADDEHTDDESPFGIASQLPNLFSMFPTVWWKGPNVCETREEFDENDNLKKPVEKKDGESESSTSSSSSEEEHGAVGVPAGPGPLAPGGLFDNFHFSSCSQTPTKYQCVTRSVNHGVQKKMVTTYKCCHGAKRMAGKPGCVMTELLPMGEAARDMDSGLFAKMISSAGLDEQFHKGRGTLFVPTDDAVRDFLDSISDQNRVRRALGYQHLMGPAPLSPVVVGDEESESSPAAPAAPVALPVAAAPQGDADDTVEEQAPTPKPSEKTVADGRSGRREDDLGAGQAASRDPEDLTDSTLVLAHYVENKLLDIEDDARNDEKIVSRAGSALRVNVFPGFMGRTYTVNCARVLKERPTQDGQVYQVDRVLTPVPAERTLAALLEKDPRLTTMRQLMRVADMMDLLREEGPLTAFFPTDEAFKRMDPAFRTELLKGEACVSSFIRNLLTKHTVCTAAARLRLQMPNLDGDYLLLERMASDDGKLTLDNVELGAHDIMASNGVLHLLNEVIVPDSARPIKDVLRSRNLTRWYDLLEKADLLAELDAAKNVTLFVPTEAALKTPEAELLLSGDDKEAIRNHLRYHIAEQMLEADELTHGQSLKSKQADKDLRVYLFSSIPFLNGAVTSATVQCGRLESVDTRACGAVLHEVDRVLAAPDQTAWDVLQQRDDLTHMRDIVEASSFKEYLGRGSSGEHPPFTLLAPTNHAIENSRLSPGRLQEIKAKKEDADAFVKRHILPTPLCCSGVGASSWLFTNRVKTLNEGLTYKIRKDSRNRVRIGDAVVQQCDKMASNGIVHIVDQVIDGREFDV
ncbi:Transforming growth factor-beta-induced protein ig-h3 [Frankliniella fusca]|uniref:Transforming growth factor-beta-induced protein ig-h3 n=1 Tax=Frankliniella fusca TaxID=407009 RepID=A0AAE1I0D5_9NEOP|nr:Transforming growth factor-beta-induced protein ig-h3 [Frankliniella fusca]